MASARKGKIARLPHAIRHELNERLRDGEPGSVILPWLNALPEVQSCLHRLFNGAEINDQNLSDWRHGGYSEWLAESTAYAEARATTEHAQYICSALGLDQSDALSVIITGHLVKLLDGDASLDDLSKLGPLFNAVTTAKKVGLAEQRVQQQAAELDLRRKRFQRETAELFIDRFEDRRATEIMSNPSLDREARIEAIGRTLFEDLWDIATKEG